MTRRADFDAAVRCGRRAGRASLVAHAYAPPAPSVRSMSSMSSPPSVSSVPMIPSQQASSVEPSAVPPAPRVGFVVSRAIGGSVVRNRVARRLRHLVRSRLPLLPPGTLLVIRALPPAATATSAELATELDSVLRRLSLVDAR
jgi:ribonuclease P protein component